MDRRENPRNTAPYTNTTRISKGGLKHTFREPDSIDQAKFRVQILVNSIQGIDRSFRLDLVGDQRGRRVRAIAGQERRLQELRFLKEWLKNRNRFVDLALHGHFSIKQLGAGDPICQILFIERMLSRTRRMIGEDFVPRDQAFLNGIRKYLCEHPDAVYDAMDKDSTP